MGLFSFGGSTSESQSSGFSDSRSEAVSGSVSGGFSRSGGASRSAQRIAFEDVFARLFGGASEAASRLDPSALTEQANLLFSGGVDFLDSLSGGAGTEFLESRVAGESPVLDEQIEALGGDIGEFFREEINPAITSEAIGAGALGGGRQGVAQGRAAEAAAEQFQRGALGLRAADIQARDAAARALGQQRIAGAGTGLSALPGLTGVAQAGFGAELAPFSALSQILGGPTTLTQAESSQFATAEDFARAFSESFSESHAEQQSSSSSKSLKLGFI